MSKIKRGVSFYSYQQSQFFKRLDLEAQIREVSELPGADGIEILDEQSLRGYPNPSDEFIASWHGWMEEYRTKPITMDVFMDVLQFRDHVMSYHECAERLKGDIRLAHKLGFQNVRALATVPIEILVEALPVAEELGIRLGKEIHAPIPINGRFVNEIVDYVDKTGTENLGLVPDMGIFQFQPSDVALEWFIRHGAKPETTKLVAKLCLENRYGEGSELKNVDMSEYTSGNLEVEFHTYLQTNSATAALEPAFSKIVGLVKNNIKDYTNIDFEVMFHLLKLSHTKPSELVGLVPYIVSIHGKFYHMTEIPDHPGEYEDCSIDYDGPIEYLKKGGYNGYINSEYEGQRFFQDLGIESLASEVDEVRLHHKMLTRLLGE